MTRGWRIRLGALVFAGVVSTGAVACTDKVKGTPKPAPYTGQSWGNQAHTPTFQTPDRTGIEGR